jgi:hypothetical protein
MFDTNFKSAGDYDLVIRLCLKGYKSVFVNAKFVTFRLGGFSSTDQKLSTDEVAKLYYKNYKKICKISPKQCKMIYYKEYDGITTNLAYALKSNWYFDYPSYTKYIENIKKKYIYTKRKYMEVKQTLTEIYDSRSWKLVVFFKNLYTLIFR